MLCEQLLKRWTKIFDKYFNQIFHKDYAPEKMQALNELFKTVIANWTNDNPMGINESLLAMKAYAPHHHLYAISAIVSEINKMAEGVPDPAKVLKLLKDSDMIESVVEMAGNCLNMAFENASAEANDNNKIFSPQNWIKAKGSLKDIRSAIRTQLGSLKMIQGGKDILNNLNRNLKMESEDFEARWTAD